MHTLIFVVVSSVTEILTVWIVRVFHHAWIFWNKQNKTKQSNTAVAVEAIDTSGE